MYKIFKVTYPTKGIKYVLKREESDPINPHIKAWVKIDERDTLKQIRIWKKWYEQNDEQPISEIEIK
jgi:hypothetical protein